MSKPGRSNWRSPRTSRELGRREAWRSGARGSCRLMDELKILRAAISNEGFVWCGFQGRNRRDPNTPHAKVNCSILSLSSRACVARRVLFASHPHSSGTDDGASTLASSHSLRFHFSLFFSLVLLSPPHFMEAASQARDARHIPPAQTRDVRIWPVSLLPPPALLQNRSRRMDVGHHRTSRRRGP